MRFLRPFLQSVLTIFWVVGHAKALGRDKRPEDDLCANVNGDINLGIVHTKLELCLCVSDIPALISTNLHLSLAAKLLGPSPVTAAVTDLIKAAVDVQECTFPEHAVPHCDSNPCDFTCADGFTPEPPSSPTSCVCNGTLCNGVCGSFPCTSQRAKRGAPWRQTTCPRGWSLCGIRGSSNFNSECVDVRRDLWSCGGCEIPLLQTDPTGLDCTAIPGVIDVVCSAGRCSVQRCREGFNISPDRTTCVPLPCPKIGNDPVS